MQLIFNMKNTLLLCRKYKTYIETTEYHINKVSAYMWSIVIVQHNASDTKINWSNISIKQALYIYHYSS